MPVLLFCREEGQGYVYCGELAYLGHDPARIPIRFVWQLTDYEQLKDALKRTSGDGGKGADKQEAKPKKLKANPKKSAA